jgi:16S rRNA (cytosine1402-N4)-methyltransferase
MSTAARHTPVMLDRCVDLLAPSLAREGAVAIDGTLGMGGHTEAILTRCPNAMVIGIDRDPQAIALASERLAPFGDRFRAHHAEYDDIAGALAVAGADAADGILLDLGVSSLQIDEADRGFSYAQDAPLDMRMNPGDPVSAADFLRDADEAEIARVLRDYGEERFAARIAESIVRRRQTAPITRSAELVDLVRACIPAATRTPGSNPAKRTFQGLRIAVNRELEVLETTMPRAIEATAVGGRIVVMSYHSLEDRIVKRAFAAGSESTAPVGLPIVPEEDKPYLRLITRGAEQASPAEAEANPRSKPVRLRAAERTRVTPPSRRGRAA